MLVSLFVVPAMWAHEEGHDDAPTAPMGAGSSRVMGGYGNIVAGSRDITSEAAANTLVDVDCSDESVRGLVTEGCAGKAPATGARPENFVNQAMRGVVFDRLRDQFLEFHSLELIASTAESKAPVTFSNLAGNRSLRNCRLSADHPLLKGARDSGSPEGHRLSERFRYVRHHLDNTNMARAFLTHEWMKTSLDDRVISPADERDHNAIPEEDREVTEYQFMRDVNNYRREHPGVEDYNCTNPRTRSQGACVSLQAQMFRLQSSFPALYHMPRMARGSVAPRAQYRESPFLWDGQQYAASGPPAVETKTGMMTAIRDLIEANGGSYDSIVAAIAKRDHVAFTAMEKELTDAIHAAEEDDASEDLKDALAQFNDVGKSIREREAATTRSRLNDLCAHRTYSGERFQRQLSEWFMLNPNVIRQFLIDADPQMRSMALAVFCQQGMMPYLRPERQCHGLSGGPLPGTDPIRTARRNYADFPLGSNHYTTISRPTDADPYTVGLTVNLQLGPNVDASDAAVNAQLQALANSWKDDVNGYINCQTGAPGTPATFANADGPDMTCPPAANMRRPPGVKVNVNFNIVPAGAEAPPPTMRLHQCFRAETGTSDCGAVRQWHLDRCVSGGDELDVCETRVAATGSPGLNRQNASNLTLGTSLGTVRHEILHQLGLRDEYEDQRTYVFNEIGEHNSIMRNSRSLESRLYPRHVDQLISVTRCPGKSQ